MSAIYLCNGEIEIWVSCGLGPPSIPAWIIAICSGSGSTTPLKRADGATAISGRPLCGGPIMDDGSGGPNTLVSLNG